MKNSKKKDVLKTWVLHHSRQRRKTISNDMCKTHRLTLTKHTATYQVAGKNWSAKRKLGIFKKEFIKHRNENTSKVKFNDYCNANGLEDYKVELKEVDILNKIKLNIFFSSISRLLCLF